MGDVLVPCRECGAELMREAAAETTAEIERDFAFGGQQATAEVAARECPACGAVTAL